MIWHSFLVLIDIYIQIKIIKILCGISFQSVNHGKVPLTFNIAYWLNYNYRGLGIMSVIVPTIGKYFFTRIKKIRGYSFFCDKENSKSAGLAKKHVILFVLGMKKNMKLKWSIMMTKKKCV